MTATLPPDPLLDALKRAADPIEAAALAAEFGRPTDHSIPMDAAAPWPGGPFHATTGVRWYATNIFTFWFLNSRKVRAQIEAPIYRFDVDEHGIRLQPRWRWIRPIVWIVFWWLSREVMPKLQASWSDITAIRRTEKSLTSWSVIEFRINDEWVGVRTFRTHSLGGAWSAVVHYFRTRREVGAHTDAKRGHSDRESHG
jgi:hypothetical protein